MERIVVTLLKNESDKTGIDVQVPNNVPMYYLLPELYKKLVKQSESNVDYSDVEFSINRADWQKVEKHHSFLEVGVYNGVYIRVMKNSKALSAPSIHPHKVNHKPKVFGKMTEKRTEEKKQETPSNGYVWKVID